MELSIKIIGKELFVDNDRIVIKQKMTRSEKVIPFSNIISVQVRKPGMITGYLYFQTIGGLNNKIKSPNEILKDENSIIVSAKNYPMAVKIKEYVENYSSKQSPNSNSSTADEILKYKQLLDCGAISQQEFDNKKAQLLGI